jgi:hypothetical protein
MNEEEEGKKKVDPDITFQAPGPGKSLPAPVVVTHVLVCSHVHAYPRLGLRRLRLLVRSDSHLAQHKRREVRKATLLYSRVHILTPGAKRRRL